VSSPDPSSNQKARRLSVVVAMHLALVTGLILACFVIMKPFLIILTWAVILAVALRAPFEKLAGLAKGKRGLAATIFSLMVIVLVVVPSWFVGGSLVGTMQTLQASLEAGTLEAPAPPEYIENIPIFGEQVYEAWTLASDDMQQVVVQFEPQLRAFGGWLLLLLAGLGGAVLQTLVALIIASVLLTYAEPATRTLRAIGDRIEGTGDEDFVKMAGATILSVAIGVLGVALVQTGIVGAGLFIAGVPAAGLLTIVAFVVAVVQIPMIILMILPIIWGFANLSIPWAITFAVFAVLAAASDMPLKAMFLGRGVPVPSAVILLGAIGGMIVMGMMGLFIGAIILGIGYKTFQFWLGGGRTPPDIQQEPAET
jgi:predicted PurR-regulated permease PerM